MRISKAETVSELKTIEKMAFEIWNQHYTPIIGASQVSYMLEKFQSLQAMLIQISEGYEYFLLEMENDPVGYLSTQVRDNRMFLSKFYVLGEHRGKGIGKKAHEFILSLAVQKGLEGIDLTVNKENHLAISVYENFGFKRTGAIVMDIGSGFVMDDYTYSFTIEK